MPLLPEFPDFEEYRAAQSLVIKLKAELRLIQLDLEEFQAEMQELKPRNASVKIIGVDAESKQRLHDLRRSEADAKTALEIAESDVIFLNYRRDVAKSAAYTK